MVKTCVEPSALISNETALDDLLDSLGSIRISGHVVKGDINTHDELEWLKSSNFTDVEFPRVAVDVQQKTAILGSRIVPGVFDHRACFQVILW